MEYRGKVQIREFRDDNLFPLAGHAPAKVKAD